MNLTNFCAFWPQNVDCCKFCQCCSIVASLQHVGSNAKWHITTAEKYPDILGYLSAPSILLLRNFSYQPTNCILKAKVAHTRLPSVGFRSWSRFLAVSLQVTWVMNPAVGCHYFPPGLQLPWQPLRRLLPISLLGEQRHNRCEQFA